MPGETLDDMLEKERNHETPYQLEESPLAEDNGTPIENSDNFEDEDAPEDHPPAA